MPSSPPIPRPQSDAQQGKRQRASEHDPSGHRSNRKSSAEKTGNHSPPHPRRAPTTQGAAFEDAHQKESALPSFVNSDLLGKFGMDNQAELESLISFIEWLFSFADDKIKRCLVAMFSGMANAACAFSQAKNEITTLNQGIRSIRDEADECRDKLQFIEALTIQKSEKQIKKLTDDFDAALIENAQLEAEGLNKDRRIEALVSEISKITERHAKECRALQESLTRSDALLHASRQNLDRCQGEIAQLNAKLCGAECRVRELTNELAEARNIELRMALHPGAPFYDPVVQGAAVCPVIQSNGLIVPFKSVIARWLEHGSPHEAHIHRTYVCPVLRDNTNLASIAIQERVRLIAQQAGICTALPFTLSVKPEDAENWTELDFHEQLKIIAHLCVVPSITHAGEEGESSQVVFADRNSLVIEIKAAISKDGNTHVNFIVENISTKTNKRYSVRTEKNVPQHDLDPFDSMIFNSVFYE